MISHVSFKDIKRTKAEAEELKQSHPELSYMQRLDLAAKNLFGLRHYRELDKLREKTIRGHLVLGDGIARCIYCGMFFAPDIPAEHKEHKVRHDNYEEAVTSLGYKPMLYAEREASKKSGHQLLHSGTPEQQVHGALTVIRGWFDRSLDKAIDGNYWKKHPRFEQYVSMINAQKSFFPAKVEEVLKEQYGELAGQIPDGHSYWYPAKR